MTRKNWLEKPDGGEKMKVVTLVVVLVDWNVNQVAGVRVDED